MIKLFSLFFFPQKLVSPKSPCLCYNNKLFIGLLFLHTYTCTHTHAYVQKPGSRNVYTANAVAEAAFLTSQTAAEINY